MFSIIPFGQSVCLFCLSHLIRFSPFPTAHRPILGTFASLCTTIRTLRPATPPRPVQTCTLGHIRNRSLRNPLPIHKQMVGLLLKGLVDFKLHSLNLSLVIDILCCFNFMTVTYCIHVRLRLIPKAH